jgi:thiamine phosphate synthase YjbQ (UPF0047 family)
MKAYFSDYKFPSTRHTYFLDITDKINKVIKKSGVKNGFVLVNTLHTTMGIVVNEIAEPNLLEDMLSHTLSLIPEDKRSTKVTKEYKHPTTDYKHRCQDNPFCNEVDEDYNAAAHIRALLYSHPSVVMPIKNGKLERGKYQQVAILELDGRNGKGKNPIRQRTIQIWVYPVDEIIKL